MLAQIKEICEFHAIGLDQDGGMVEVYGIRPHQLEVGMIVEGNLFNEEDELDKFYMEATKTVDKEDERLKSLRFTLDVDISQAAC